MTDLKALLASQIRIEEALRRMQQPIINVNVAAPQPSPLEPVLARKAMDGPRDRFGIPFVRPTIEPR
jgi:hypothetical protein